MCDVLAQSPSIVQRTGYHVDALTAVDDEWRVEGRDRHNQTWFCQAEVAIICSGPKAASLQPSANLPITPVRGQITLAPSTRASENLKTIVCTSGYLAPSNGGFHLIGATHRFNDEETGVRIAEHLENLSRLAEMSPGLAKAAAIMSQGAGQLEGRASIRASVPGAMPLVGELSPRLYTSLAHGTRGLITAGLSGEVIAAAACGQLPPLPLHVLAALAPTVRGQQGSKQTVKTTVTG
jgi:tRNA 5-methylaminomethyl-2-thiouridine biosynthesis bifunctional protein